MSEAAAAGAGSSNSADRCDVLVVGGGPAGSTLAWALRDSGLDVMIMDKRGFPRDKTCAGWVTPAVVQALAIDTGDYARGRVFQPIHGFRVGVIGGAEVETHHGEAPVSFGIRRFEFDHYLLSRCGARMRLKEPFKAMERRGGRWLVNGAVDAGLVVGAGGHFCPVARSMGAKLGRSETPVTAQEIEFEMSAEQQAACPASAEQPELYFCADLKGYGWLFRKGNYLNIGLGREDNHKLAEHVEAFVDFLKARGRVPDGVPSRFHGHAYLLYNHAPREVIDDGVLLIGDAAGLAYPQSGEGIRPAVESALLAAAAVRAAQGDYSRDRLLPYRQRLFARFGRRNPPPGLSERLPSWVKQPLARRLLSSRWFARHVVMDRWFLHVHEEPLAVE